MSFCSLNVMKNDDLQREAKGKGISSEKRSESTTAFTDEESTQKVSLARTANESTRLVSLSMPVLSILRYRLSGFQVHLQDISSKQDRSGLSMSIFSPLVDLSKCSYSCFLNQKYSSFHRPNSLFNGFNCQDSLYFSDMHDVTDSSSDEEGVSMKITGKAGKESKDYFIPGSGLRSFSSSFVCLLFTRKKTLGLSLVSIVLPLDLSVRVLSCSLFSRSRDSEITFFPRNKP